MNEKLQRWYYILGIAQRVSMVILTFLIMGVAYKVLSLAGNFQITINELHDTVNKLYILIDRSWLF
jgi:succinate dehydrogenase hydrophobic anchor subunit